MVQQSRKFSIIALLFLLVFCHIRLLDAIESSEEWEDVSDDSGDIKVRYRVLGREEAIEIFDEIHGHIMMEQMLAAIYADDTEAFSALLTKYPSYVNATTTVYTDTDVPIVIMAALYARLDIVKLLVAQGADVNANLELGYSVLDYAVHQGYAEIAEWLLENGAKSGMQHLLKGTPLHVAAMSGDAAMMEVLLRRGGWNVDVRDPDNSTPLHRATNGHNRIALKELLAKYHRNLATKSGVVNFPSNRAQHDDPLAVVKLLIDAGADVNLLDGYNEDSIRHVVKTGRLDIAELLLKSGADPLIWDSSRKESDSSYPGVSGKYRRLSEVAERDGYGQSVSGMLNFLLNNKGVLDRKESLPGKKDEL